MPNDKQSGEVLIQRAVKTTIQLLHGKKLFDIYDYADEVINNFLHFDEVKERCRIDLDELNEDNVMQWVYT